MQLQHMSKFADTDKCLFFNFGKQRKMIQIRLFARKIFKWDFIGHSCTCHSIHLFELNSVVYLTWKVTFRVYTRFYFEQPDNVNEISGKINENS